MERDMRGLSTPVVNRINRCCGGALLAWAVVLSTIDARVAAQHTPPSRIVSTSPSITETLFAMGLGSRVVGVSTYCRFPPEVATLPKVGGFLNPDAEIIARLKPDLVFVHAGPGSVNAQLRALGIAAATVERGSLPSLFDTIRQIGDGARQRDRAERLVSEIRARLEGVRAAVDGRRARTILLIVGRQTGTLRDIVAVGHASYLSDVAAIAGGVNALPPSVTAEYPRISMETVIGLAPDVIVDVGEMGDSPADSDRRRRHAEHLWQQQTLVHAVRAGRVHVTTDEAFVVPGPRVVHVAETLAAWLHGVRPR